MSEQQSDTQKLEWIEPETRELEARETAANSGIGIDGGNYADCTAS